MQPRERVRQALAHHEPDRVPVDYWASPQFTPKLLAHFGLASQEELLGRLGVDLRYVLGPSYTGLELRAYPDGTSEDLWGVRRKTVTVVGPAFEWTYKEVVESPLAGATTPAEVAAYGRWPSPDWWDYSSLPEQCQRAGDHAVVLGADRLDRTAQLKTGFYLRGMEQFLTDLVLDPRLAEAIIGRVVEYYLEYNRRVFEATRGLADIFFMGDDFGMQQGPIVSPNAWRRFFRPGFRQFVDLAHRYGLKVMHHTCGSVRALIPDLIDAGLDILQSVQPRAAGMDLASLKREFGRDICFQGSIDIQHVMPHGTVEEVRDHVRRQLDAGKPGGGFIVCTAHDLLPDVPVENAVALFEAYREYGGYGP